MPGRSDEQAFHFAHSLFKLPYADATGHLVSILREKQSSPGRSVVSREASQFLFKVLKAKTDFERGGVFEK